MRAEVLSVDLQHGHVSSAVHLRDTRAAEERCARLRQDRQPHLQRRHHRKGRDGRGDAGRALIEGELHRLHPDDGPAGTVVQHHPASVSGAAGRLGDTAGLTQPAEDAHAGDTGGSDLVAHDAVVGQAQVGVGAVLELEGALVELRHGLVHVQNGVLLVDLADHLNRGRERR